MIFSNSHQFSRAKRGGSITFISPIIFFILLMKQQSSSFLLVPMSQKYSTKSTTILSKRMNPSLSASSSSDSSTGGDTKTIQTQDEQQTQMQEQEQRRRRRRQELLQELFYLLEETPANAPTSRELTNKLLNVVNQLEQQKYNPTMDDDVLKKLGGTWELLWTTQDRSSQQYNQQNPFRSWINPLENQSYSNNPNGAEGRMNPVLPRPIQDQLERMGIIKIGDDDDEQFSNVRSSQTIDIQKGRVRNLVTFGIPGPTTRRLSLTVDVDFVPDPNNKRRVNVKFQSCRVVIPKTSVDITIPLGIIGPTGWLETNYIDDDIRITRGHKGSVFVLKRPSSTTSSSTTTKSSSASAGAASSK